VPVTEFYKAKLMINKKLSVKKEKQILFCSGRDAEGRKALEWLRGSPLPSAISREVRAIKLEMEKKAAAPVSGKQPSFLQLSPAFSRFL